jgi:hypothetical protein
MLKRNTCNNSTKWLREFRLHPVLSQTFVTGYVGDSMSIVGRERGDGRGVNGNCYCVCVRGRGPGGVRVRERETDCVAILLCY